MQAQAHLYHRHAQCARVQLNLLTVVFGLDDRTSLISVRSMTALLLDKIHTVESSVSLSHEGD